MPSEEERASVPKSSQRGFGGPGKGRAPAEKPKDFKTASKRLVKELNSFKVSIIIALALAMIGAGLTIYAPNKLTLLTDEISNGLNINTNFSMDMAKITYITIVLACVYFFSGLFSFIQTVIMTKVSNFFAKQLRSRISKKINKLPLKYFDRHQTGDILSRVTNDVDTIAQSMNQSLGTIVTSITLLIGSVVMMFVTNGIMALTAIGASLIGFIGMGQILKKSQKYFLARQVELGKLNGHIEEIFSGLNVVKVYNGKKCADEKFDELNQSVYDCNRKSQFLSGLMQPLMAFIGNFGYVAVCIVGAILTMNNVFSFGVIIAFIVYVRLFTHPLSQIAQALTAIQTTAAASERVFEFLDEEEMDSQNEISKCLDKNNVKGKIEFKDVVFQYDNNDKPTIKHFSAIANPGQKIAIVGPTGAGKTTLVNLLMKFYEISSGEIIIDGVSTKELSRENIHDLFTMVLQDTWLFEGTVRENIAYNVKDVSDEKIEEVCKEVGLHHFIKTLPNGYDSELSENNSISAGQKQLLTIARGMIKDSPFLILDEATSNVDTRTEELVQEAMDKISKGKTSFIIAHRLSTIKNADLILVIGDGNIVEQGNHEELLAKKGVYANLYNSQFEL
ncbi:MAG: ABC transporter ATP-binding protein [Clostridia bacterium]|nr:ABC transporter ATP-binding protein [Clostridia bacterium]